MDQNVILMIIPFSLNVIKLKVGSLALNVIAGFSHIVPEIFFKTIRIQFSLFSQLWEDLLFDHAESLRNPVDDFLVEDVHACVDLVANELFWFLYKAKDSVVLICDYNPESAWIFDCCEDD